MVHETARLDAEAADLMVRVRRGDRAAFERLVQCLWNRTLDYALYLQVDLARAEDATQEAFCRLWERRRQWRRRGGVRPWLLKTVRNLVIGEHRKGKVRTMWAFRQTQMEPDGPATPLQETEAHELEEGIELALQQLSPRRREALTLFHLQGLSYREVGKIMEVRPQTAANYVQAALADLRVLLAKFLPETPTRPRPDR